MRLCRQLLALGKNLPHKKHSLENNQWTSAHRLRSEALPERVMVEVTHPAEVPPPSEITQSIAVVQSLRPEADAGNVTSSISQRGDTSNRKKLKTGQDVTREEAIVDDEVVENENAPREAQSDAPALSTLVAAKDTVLSSRR